MSNESYVKPLIQFQPTNIVDRAPISVMQVNEQQGKIEEQQRKIDNTKMLGTARAQLEEKLRQLKLEGHSLRDQLF